MVGNFTVPVGPRPTGHPAFDTPDRILTELAVSSTAIRDTFDHHKRRVASRRRMISRAIDDRNASLVATAIQGKTQQLDLIRQQSHLQRIDPGRSPAVKAAIIDACGVEPLVFTPTGLLGSRGIGGHALPMESSYARKVAQRIVGEAQISAKAGDAESLQPSAFVRSGTAAAIEQFKLDTVPELVARKERLQLGSFATFRSETEAVTINDQTPQNSRYVHHELRRLAGDASLGPRQIANKDQFEAALAGDTDVAFAPVASVSSHLPGSSSLNLQSVRWSQMLRQQRRVGRAVSAGDWEGTGADDEGPDDDLDEALMMKPILARLAERRATVSGTRDRPGASDEIEPAFGPAEDRIKSQFLLEMEALVLSTQHSL
jgi:hypothetical protein